MDDSSGPSAVEGVAQRTDRAHGLALVEQWRSSRQTIAQFCRDQGVPVHRLHYWKRQAECGASGQDAARASEFLAMEIRGASPGSTARDGKSTSIEIVIGAVRVQLPLGCDRESFVRILRWTAEALDA